MNRNSKPIHNLYTHKMPMTKLAVKEMQYAKFYATLLVLVVLVGFFSISPAISTLMNDVIITSTGKIGTRRVVVANSGSARDIQAAVDEVVAAGGIGDVQIPAGTFNFVEIGESWMTVNVPAGVNIFGAPTERDANDQVIEWKTVLVMPYDAPSSTWFWVQGSGDPNVPWRFSDIKMIGWRYYDNSSITMYTGLSIDNVINFRVDHCHFQDMAGSAIYAGSYPVGGPPIPNNDACSGVIDHNRLVNSYGNPGVVYEERTLGYGIGMTRWPCSFWDYDLSNVIGRYNNYTVFIEDNYFSKWRHTVCSNDGYHYVFRHNIVEGDYGFGSIDSHGSRADADKPYAVGTRAIEVYENTFKDPDFTFVGAGWVYAVNHRGGSGIIFNNTIKDYYAFLHLNSAYDWGNELLEYCRIWDTYIWDNTMTEGTKLIGYNSGFPTNVENVNYFLRPPSVALDGFEYTPYPYPHPLTLEAAP